MIATDIRTVMREGKAVLSASVRAEKQPGAPFVLEWVFPEAEADWLAANGDPVLPALLLPAMRLGEDLVIDAPVSRRLLASVPTIMDIYAAWVPGMRRPAITANDADEPRRGKGVGLFFSCGVDSFYSLRKALAVPPEHDDAVSHLILIYGFDIRPRNPALFDLVAGHARSVAAAAHRKLVIVETNLRTFSDPLVGWDFYHGGALASTALALGGLQRKCFIPSTHAYGELVPWGSHPLLDPLWSTDSVDLVHDGCEALRTEKIKELASFDLALQHLRVCWPDWIQDYNCGRCEKCLRTMIGLHVAGALERAATFPRRLDLQAIRDVQLITGESSVRFMEDLLAALGPSPEGRPIARAIRRAVWKNRFRAQVAGVIDRTPGARATLAALRGKTPPPAASAPLADSGALRGGS